MSEMFLEFSTEHEVIHDLYISDPFIFRIEFDKGNNGSTGRAFKDLKEFNRKKDFITIDLGEEFYDFILRHRYDSRYKDIDLRIAYYLNRNYYNQTTNDYYYMKHIRDTYYEFSTNPICEHYDNPDPHNVHFKIACINTAVGNVNGRSVCPIHVNI